MTQAWLLALLAAQKDDRLALLQLGHLHHMGLHGAPTDLDLAYGYYANIGKQTTLDRHNPTPNQVMHVLNSIFDHPKLIYTSSLSNDVFYPPLEITVC